MTPGIYTDDGSSASTDVLVANVRKWLVLLVFIMFTSSRNTGSRVGLGDLELPDGGANEGAVSELDLAGDVGFSASRYLFVTLPREKPAPKPFSVPALDLFPPLSCVPAEYL